MNIKIPHVVADRKDIQEKGVMSGQNNHSFTSLYQSSENDIINSIKMQFPLAKEIFKQLWENAIQFNLRLNFWIIENPTLCTATDFDLSVSLSSKIMDYWQNNEFEVPESRHEMNI